MFANRSIWLPTAALAAILALAPGSALAQLRRSGGPPPDGNPGEPPVSFPRRGASPDAPFAGMWEGSATLARGPGAAKSTLLRVAFDVANSARPTYSGATILPNDAHAAHVDLVVRGRELEWRQPNSGGGFWVYSARLVAPDSIAGSFALRDWPQLRAGESPPVGTVVLVRRHSGSRGGI